MSFSDITSSSATSHGAIAQTAYKIGMDHALNTKPKHTFFRHRWLSYAPFAIETLSHTIQNARFGADNVGAGDACKLSDLVYKASVRYVIPALDAVVSKDGSGRNYPCPPKGCDTACARDDISYFSMVGDGDVTAGIQKYLTERYGASVKDRVATSIEAGADRGDDGEVWCHWVDQIATVLTKKVTVSTGTQPVDALSRRGLFVWSELTVSASHRVGYNEMIGRSYSREDLIADSKRERVVYQELPFWHTTTPAKAFASIASLYSPLRYSFQFAPLEECIIRSAPNVRVLKAKNGTELNESDLKANIDLSHIYLETYERDRFGTTPYDLVVSLHSEQTFHTVGTSRKLVHIESSHLATELNWMIQRKCATASNDHFSGSGLLGLDPMFSAAVKFGGVMRQQEREGTFYRLVQNRQLHTAIPDSFIYTYGFCLAPEADKPTGGAGLARFNGVSLDIKLQAGLEQEDIEIWTMLTTLNLLKHRDMCCGTAFG